MTNVLYVNMWLREVIISFRMVEQRNKLLMRTRRGAKKKGKDKKGKKKPSKSGPIGRITTGSKSKNKKEKKPSKVNAAKITGGSGGGGRQKTPKPNMEEFKSCTATMITNKCLLTTAACTGNDKNVNLFAKIGERAYGSNVSIYAVHPWGLIHFRTTAYRPFSSKSVSSIPSTNLVMWPTTCKSAISLSLFGTPVT